MCLRCMAGVTKGDRIMNEVILTRASEMTAIAWRVDKSVLKWFSHMEIIDENSLTNRLMSASFDCRAPRGRPRFCWMDGGQEHFE